MSAPTSNPSKQSKKPDTILTPKYYIFLVFFRVFYPPKTPGIKKKKPKNLRGSRTFYIGGGGRIRTIEAKRSRFTVCINILFS